MVLMFVLLVVAAFAKAVMDRSSEGAPFIWGGSSSYWSKSESWTRKWKHGDRNLGEAFPGSSTVFVFITDAWHLAQFFFLNSLFALIVIRETMVSTIVDFLILSVAFRVVFELSYRAIRRT